MMPVLAAQNDQVAIQLHADGSFALSDPTTGKAIRSGSIALQEEGPIDVGHVWLRGERFIPEQWAARFEAVPHDDGTATVTVLERQGQAVGSFRVSLSVDGPWAEMEIHTPTDSLPSLIYPPALPAEELAVPQGVGRRITQDLPSRYFWGFNQHVNMRWFGGYDALGEGWITVFHQGYEDAGISAIKRSLHAGWLRSLGKWQGTRKLRFRLTTGGYVGLAKSFRAWAKQAGLYRSLADKLAAKPNLQPMVGGRMLSFMQSRPRRRETHEAWLNPVPTDLPEDQFVLSFTHQEVLSWLDEAERRGLHGIANVRGWIAGGYDDTHPDVWPPEPRLGTLDQFRTLCRRPGNFPVVLHDNYADIYPRTASWPRGVIEGPTGRRMAGGVWAGGQCYILNSRVGLENAQRNWESIRQLQPAGMFPDTVSAVRLYENWAPDFQHTRSEDVALKIQLLHLFGDEGIVGSEEGSDFAVPHLDWFENRHARVPGVSIPLWPLVFGDCSFHVRYTHGAVLNESEPRWLTDMLWGYNLVRSPMPGAPDPEEPDSGGGVWDADRQVDEWQAKVSGVEMVSHRYLDQAGMVEETEWANGARLRANFSPEPFDGLAPGDYLATDPSP